MSKVKVLMNDGTIKEMSPYYARALIHCKKAVMFNDYEKKVVKSDGYKKKALGSSESGGNELLKLRAEYQEKFGKRAFHGWGAEELKSKINEG